MKILKIVLLLYFPFITFAQSFELMINSLEDEQLINAIEDSNGDFILCGQIGDYNTNIYDGYLVKVNSNGDTILTKRFTNTGNYLGFSTIVEQTDGYLLLGYLNPYVTNTREIFIKKVDFNFVELWTKEYGRNDYDYAFVQNVLAEGTNKYTAIGSSIKAGDPRDFFIFQFNGQGDSLNSKYFNYPGLEMGYDILLTDSGYKVFTMSLIDTIPAPNEILNIDFNLNITSVTTIPPFPPNTFGGNLFYMNTVTKWINDDSIYIAYARIINKEYAGQDANKAKGTGLLFFNSNDSILSAYVFGKPDTSEVEAMYGMDFISSSAIYIGGTSDFDNSFPSFTNHKNWYNLNKIDSDGNIQWEKWYGGDANYLLWKVLATQDGGCMMIGTRYDSIQANGQQQRDIYIIKVDSDGIVSAVNNLQLTKSNFIIYPNPASEEFYIKGNFALPATLKLYDIMGRKVVEKSLNSNYSQININHLSKGLYVYHLMTDDKKIGRGKLVVE